MAKTTLGKCWAPPLLEQIRVGKSCRDSIQVDWEKCEAIRGLVAVSLFDAIQLVTIMCGKANPVGQGYWRCGCLGAQPQAGVISMLPINPSFMHEPSRITMINFNSAVQHTELKFSRMG
ncbi:hypothetical protein CSAL01_12169 [Colletotrichum salicis]|uniref:Uncharacterized protein n=1 Tax=Colletotrichum salicis TaxID=1209931 RepID=A0A135T5G4_9PEZI|nr:hypothetical protein CSAL01_12169 [Colletotrichum salicis]